MTMFYLESDAEKVSRNTDAVFGLHGKALAWLEEYTGLKFPFDKFDFVVLPAFPFGGMEHPGSIFYGDKYIFLDPSATQSQYLERAHMIAHEAAHAWFGDSVTMRWFDDVWLKEVFANFMADKNRESAVSGDQPRPTISFSLLPVRLCRGSHCWHPCDSSGFAKSD